MFQGFDLPRCEPCSRCDSEIRYHITSTGRVDCPDPHGNESIVVNGTHLLELQGRQCGYVSLLSEILGKGAGGGYLFWASAPPMRSHIMLDVSVN